MAWLTDILIQGAVYLKPYTLQVSVALVATLLVIYGNVINRGVRLLIRPYPMVLRISVFVLLCTVGYGALTVWCAGQLQVLLGMIPDVVLGPTVVLAFIILGFLAERFHKTT